MISPLTTSFRESAISTPKLIHKAIRDEEYARLPALLVASPGGDEDDPSASSLLWEPNAQGWTAVHLAACRHSSSSYWWKWILDQVYPSSDLFHTKLTDMGHSASTLFFLHSLYPLTWQNRQVHAEAAALHVALRAVLRHDALFREFRTALESQTFGASSHAHVPGGDFGQMDVEDRTSMPPVERVVRFWTHLEWLLRAMNGFNSDRNDGNPSYLASLASLQWCPDLVAQLALRLDQRNSLPLSTKSMHNASSSYEHSTSALIIWANTSKRSLSDLMEFPAVGDPLVVEEGQPIYGSVDGCDGSTNDGPITTNRSLLEAILERDPHSATNKDLVTNRLPLHLALAEGKPFSSIYPLFKAYPEALVEFDTSVTGLPAVCLAALQAPPLPRVIERIARGLRSSSWSVWQYLPSKTKELARHAAREECDRQQLDTIYQLLRQNPMVLSLGS